MIEARALVSINFLNLSENYDFMSRWLGVYDKYAKLLKGSSDAVVKDGSGKNDDSKVDAISGATITRRAVTSAVKSCVAYSKSLKGGN